jgi:hypothetical protein
MNCTCEQARREARAEAFEAAAAYCAQGSDILFVSKQRHAEWVMVKAAEHFAALAAAERVPHARGDDLRTTVDKLRAALAAPYAPVRYTEAPEPETPPEGASSGATRATYVEHDHATGASRSFTIEGDGFTTEHATGWPKRLIPDWPDSYPFEVLDPWPGADGGRDGA